MVEVVRFVDVLKVAGVEFFAGVPDSLLKSFCAYVMDTWFVKQLLHHLYSTNGVSNFEPPLCRRSVFNRTLDAIGMKLFCIILVLLLSLSGVAAEQPKTVPAWKNAVDKKSAEEAVRAYTANEIRCEWAGEDPRVASLMPANLGFQFAVVGDSEVTNRVQKVLKEVAGSFSPELRQDLEMRGLLNPTLQWLVRSCRPGVTNWQEYIKPQNHPAVFKESDFNAYDLKYFASRLKTGQIPLPVTVTLSYVDQVGFLGKANPGIDYPDVLPEETFTLPFGSAIVARAPERRRKIRLRATAWPYGKKPSGYVWKATGGVRILPWTSDGRQTPELGFADVIYYLPSCRPRLDIMVWAKFGREVCGPPTIISIYNIPYDQRRYSKKGLESITYVKTSPYVPYDVSAIWVPHSVKIIEPDVFGDARGWFCETYNAERYRKAGIENVFVQDNESFSSKGVVRGLHWQAAPHTQAKLVRVIHGAVWDVVVDIRKSSPTFGKHIAVTLTGENRKQFYIPRGFAHGFIVLEDNTLFSYKCDNLYCPAADRGMRFDDPALEIKWPDIGVPLILSAKDQKHPLLADITPWEEAVSVH